MKLSGIALLAPFLLFGSTNACSGGEDPSPDSGGSAGTGTAGSGGTAGAGGTTAGSAGSSAGTTTAGTAGSAAGTAGAGGSAAGAGGSSGGSSANDSPSDTTEAGITAFIDAMSYKGTGWVDNGEPVETSPHGLVKSWFNTTLRQSVANADNPRTTGSMVVKEIYQGSAIVGHAVLLRTEGGWIYYCDSSAAGLCYTGHTAGETIYGASAVTTNCACHGSGTVITPVPPP